MFNPKSCPAYTKGRWYEFLIESDGSDYSLTSADLDGCVITSNYLKMPADFQLVDFMHEVHYSAGSNTFNNSRYVGADERVCVALPPKDKIDWDKVYVFGYFEA